MREAHNNMQALPDILGDCMLRSSIPRQDDPLKLYTLRVPDEKLKLVPYYIDKGYQSQCRLCCIVWVTDDLYIECRFIDGKNKRISLFDAVLQACDIVASPKGKEFESYHVLLLFNAKMQPTWLSVE